MQINKDEELKKAQDRLRELNEQLQRVEAERNSLTIQIVEIQGVTKYLRGLRENAD